jgi:hypothetical protein
MLPGRGVPEDQTSSVAVAEIDGDAALVAVVDLERSRRVERPLDTLGGERHPPEDVRSIRRLDSDDVSAEVAQVLRTERPWPTSLTERESLA